jgi:hypothetical protein
MVRISVQPMNLVSAPTVGQVVTPAPMPVGDSAPPTSEPATMLFPRAAF